MIVSQKCVSFKCQDRIFRMLSGSLRHASTFLLRSIIRGQPFVDVPTERSAMVLENARGGGRGPLRSDSLGATSHRGHGRLGGRVRQDEGTRSGRTEKAVRWFARSDAARRPGGGIGRGRSARLRPRRAGGSNTVRRALRALQDGNPELLAPRLHEGGKGRRREGAFRHQGARPPLLGSFPRALPV